MKKVILKVDGMSCSACSNRVEKYLNKQDGVEASVNLVMAQALVNYDPNKVNIDDLARFIKESGYKYAGIYEEKVENKKDNSKYYLIGFLLLIVIFMLFSMGHMIKIHHLNHSNPILYGIICLVFSIPFIIYGIDILISGVKKITHPNMDSLVSVGVIASFIYSLVNLIRGDVNHLYFESVAMIIFFIKLGRYIDGKSKEKTKESLKELVTITPQSATLKSGKEVTIDEVREGDILACKAGMKIAVDGVIVSGSAYFDESFISGESNPSKKEKGDKVLAGSINLDGYVEYEAEGIGPNSTISEIVRLVAEASNTKMKLQRIVDKVASIFVPSIFVIALFTFWIYVLIGKSFNESIISFVTVLVVACPCALGLATPLAIVVAEGTSARKGILIKTSETLESVYRCDTVVFDKTGTLTYGDIRINKINNYSDYSEEELLKIVGSLEKNSTHPISKAFNTGEDKVTNFKNLEGIGITGMIGKHKYFVGNNKVFSKVKVDNEYLNDEEELVNDGNTIVYVIEDKKVIGLIGVRDIIRESSYDTVKELLKMKKDVVLLSGDNETAAKVIADSVGIRKVISNVMPQDKEKYISELVHFSHKVMMVGDGINDALALSKATVGVSVSGGTDIAGNSSDVILMQDDLKKIIELYKISEKTIRIIKENLFWAFIYNICMIPIAIGVFKNFGLSINPMIASAAMMISSLCVVFNSLRLRRIK